MTRHLVPLLLALAALPAGAATPPRPPPPEASPFIEALRREGQEPVAFVRHVLEHRDLVVFDDGLHTAAEPWQLYLQLLRDPAIRRQVRLVFVEVLGVGHQRDLDGFFAQESLDLARLAPALQDDFSGYGWRHQNLQDFLAGLWELNHGLPAAERIRVVGVAPPVFWAGLRTRADYDAFLASLRSFDHFMAATIAEQLEDFKAGRKAFFLTNTRHAYLGLRAKDGSLLWNATTFLAQQHPGKVASLRVHNLALQVTARRPVEGRQTAAGMEGATFSWVRMAGGAWDAAFRARGDRPVAVPLDDNAFGRTPYVGNQMLSARAGSRMSEVHDGLIFLAPLESLTSCATSDLVCTPAFRDEVRRRIQVMEGADLAGFLEEEGAASLDEFLDAWAKPRPARPGPRPAGE